MSNIYQGQKFEDTKQVHIRMSESVKERLDKFCKEHNSIEKSYVINRVIEEGINYFEKGDKTNE